MVDGSRYFCFQRIFGYLKFKEKNNVGYQSLGSIILNENFPNIEKINNNFKNLNILNINKNIVYGVGPNEITNLYQKNLNIDFDETIGVHWFGGHKLSKEYESLLTIDNINTINNSLSGYIRNFLNDKNNNNSI